MRTTLRTAAAAATLLALAACSSDEAVTVGETGWLGPLTGLRQIEGSDESGLYVQPAGLSGLKAVYVAPTEITVAPGSDLDAISPEDIAVLRDGLRKVVTGTLKGRFDVAEEPGPDRLIVRVALTNVRIRYAGNPVLTPRPVDLRFGFADAALEADVRAAENNVRRAAAVIRLPQKSADKTPNRRLRDLPGDFAAYAAALRDGLEKIGKAPAAEARTEESGKAK